MVPRTLWTRSAGQCGGTLSGVADGGDEVVTGLEEVVDDEAAVAPWRRRR